MELVGRASVGRVDALGWLNKNQVADLKSYDRAERWEHRTTTCIKGAIIVRRRVLTFTHAVDNGTTLYGVHSGTVVLIKCTVCAEPHSLTRTPRECLKKTIHDK